MTQSFGVSSESLCKDLILEYLNNAVGHTEAVRDHYWCKVRTYLGQFLIRTETRTLRQSCQASTYGTIPRHTHRGRDATKLRPSNVHKS